MAKRFSGGNGNPALGRLVQPSPPVWPNRTHPARRGRSQLLCSQREPRYELESATIGQAVAVLVEKGLIERERAAHDRRVWNLHLTEQVRTIWPELREAADRLHEILWKEMSAPEIDLLRTMLRKVAENQKQADTCEESR